MSKPITAERLVADFRATQRTDRRRAKVRAYSRAVKVGVAVGAFIGLGVFGAAHSADQDLTPDQTVSCVTTSGACR